MAPGVATQFRMRSGGCENLANLLRSGDSSPRSPCSSALCLCLCLPVSTKFSFSRAFKAVEATLAELPCPTASTGPRVMTRATSGMWLALRAETIALHETRRGLTNRIHGDGGADRTGGARRPEKRRRP